MELEAGYVRAAYDGIAEAGTRHSIVLKEIKYDRTTLDRRIATGIDIGSVATSHNEEMLRRMMQSGIPKTAAMKVRDLIRRDYLERISSRDEPHKKKRS